jgi:nucleoredoxin
MLYFTASWCPPCRRFTPTLVQLYESQTSVIEIVLVSSDEGDREAAEYRSHMPWLSLPDLGRQGSDTVRDLCQVRGIPQLLVLESATGEVVAQNAVPNAAQVFADLLA